jgi:hypothetical protein
MKQQVFGVGSTSFGRKFWVEDLRESHGMMNERMRERDRNVAKNNKEKEVS